MHEDLSEATGESVATTARRELKPLKRRKREKDTVECVAGVIRWMSSLGKRLGWDDPEELVHALAVVDAANQLLADMVAGLREHGQYTDRQIGAVLGMQKQSVAERWPRSPNGAAPTQRIEQEEA